MRSHGEGGLIVSSSGGASQSPSSGQWVERVRRAVATVILPLLIAATTAVAAAKHGPVRVYWTLGAIFFVLVSGVFTYTNDRNAIAYRNNAFLLKTELATALNNTARPVVVALGNVAAASQIAPAREALAILRDRAVSLAQSEIGTQSSCKIRAAFYSFEEGNRKLVRASYQGWSGCKAPRTEFLSGRSDHDDEVIKFALGEDSLLVRDLENDPPAHFSDPKGRTYKSFVSVPVRAGTVNFGLLTADADSAYALTEIDEGYLVLIAGALAAGLAHTETVAARGTPRSPGEGGSGTGVQWHG